MGSGCYESSIGGNRMSSDPLASEALVLQGVAGEGVAGDGPLRGLDLEVHPGEVLGVLGDRTSGVATLLARAAGRGRPEQGKVHLPGPGLLLAAEPYLGPLLRIDELGGALGADPARYRELCERLAVGPWLGLAAPAPGWARRRALAAAALAARPAVLAVEEPCRGFDLEALAVFDQALEELAEQGACVLVGAYLPWELPSCTRRVAWVEDGRVAGTRTQPQGPAVHELAAWMRGELEDEVGAAPPEAGQG